MRLFVGISLPEEAQRRLGLLNGGLPGARWIEPYSLHVTLRFLGEIDRSTAEDIDAALGDIRASAFGLALSGLGFFDRGGKVHTLWVGIERSDMLMYLHDKIESVAVRAGLEPERRKFTPHVTIARLKDTPGSRLGPYLEAHSLFSAGPFAVTQFTLFRSHPGNEGAHYEPLADYPLAGV